MLVLLDTHALQWWVQDDPKVYVSAASAWEIATKVRIGKLPGAEAFAADPVESAALRSRR